MDHVTLALDSECMEFQFAHIILMRLRQDYLMGFPELPSNQKI